MAWSDAVITNVGVALLAEALAGETLTIDGASGGTGTASASSLLAQTALVNQKQTFVVVELSDVDGGKKLNIQITSEDLTTGYTLNQVGIWAHVGDNDAQLFAILQDEDGINIPSESSVVDFSMNFYAIVAVSGEAEFSLTVDPTGLVTLATMNVAIEALEAEVAEALASVGDAASAVTLTFDADDWSDSTFTIPKTDHGKTSGGFTYTVRHLVEGVIKTRTWALMSVNVSYDSDTENIIVTAEGAFAGEITIVG